MNLAHAIVNPSFRLLGGVPLDDETGFRQLA